MRFELQIALKYLIPKKGGLSTSLISLLSVFLIALVIWLVLVFLSVTSGMEKNWLQKLTSLHAPIRISPTDAYYSSYYYKIDSLSAASDYSVKTIGEKKEAPLSDPYKDDTDLEIPPYWTKPEKTEGTLCDPVKLGFQELERMRATTPGLTFQDYEISGALLKIHLSHGSSISQMTYLLSLAEENPHLASLFLSSTIEASTPIYLPKNYQTNGVKLGDKASLHFSSPMATALQEQRLDVTVAGFYDPGIFAIGNKCVLVPSSVTRSISAVHQTISPDGTPTNGIFVWVKDLKNTKEIAERIKNSFERIGIAPYWKIATYEEFEFSKDLLLQFQSDRLLLLLIASIILIVAVSNIFSLLVLLIHDKKREIAILQSMGATRFSTTAIFAICGATLGTLGCLFGMTGAFFTLHNLNEIVSFLSRLQGRALFNPAFFGQSLPNQLSHEALLFVLCITPILSLIAGLIPALKASKIHPSSTLRAE